MPAVGRFNKRETEMSGPYGVFSVTAEPVSAKHKPLCVLTVVFHYICFHTAVFCVGVRADTGCLKPESRVPARIFGKTASYFIIAEFVHKFCLFKLSERPHAGCILRNIICKRACLKMSRIKVLALFNQRDNKVAVTVHRNALARERGRFFAPEILAEVPFRFVKTVAVKFVLPSQSPTFFFRKIARRVVFNFKFFQFSLPPFGVFARYAFIKFSFVVPPV